MYQLKPQQACGGQADSVGVSRTSGPAPVVSSPMFKFHFYADSPFRAVILFSFSEEML